MKLIEGDLVFDFTDAKKGIVFDQMNPTAPDYHGIGEMHRVDFVVEFEAASVFVEVKDPKHPQARAEGLRRFLAGMEDGTLYDTFASKLIDSFLYRWAEDEASKPIYYINLVTLDTAQLLSLREEVIRRLPPIGIPAASRWKRSFIESCQFFNIETWNASFPKWPVSRTSLSISEVEESTPQEGV
ncbi:MAG: hypothetical protein AAFV85_05065 [Cyanobacteria bacterium J06634_6]